MGSPDEKKRFIENSNSTPVKLDPGFDSLDRTVEFTNIEKQPVEEHPPQDR